MENSLKNIIGQFSAAASLYDAIRPGRPRTRYKLENLAAHLPAAVQETRPFAEKAEPGRRLVIFATLHYWIEQAAMVGLALRGMGHDVTLAYLPYSTWEKEINRLDLQRQDLYTRRVLTPLQGLVKSVSLLQIPGRGPLPAQLERAVETASAFDVMYSLQVEDVDRGSALYRLRLERNRSACLSALQLLTTQGFETVLVPNGLVTELGIFFQAARHLDLPTVTYEFNDQREQIWVAQNDIVMRQNTDDLWKARANSRLTDAERTEIRALEESRSGGRVYGKGTRFWQDTPAEGGRVLREKLGLDDRPVVLLATNVLGDSLTLGRHLFASSMEEWIERTVRYFAARPDVQLVVRVHPGERLIKGTSMVGVVQRAAPQRPEHIHVVGPKETLNTYDVMEIASLGLVYTTTVGMEIAMRGVPVIVAGMTHFARRGFTLDPTSWEEYFSLLDEFLQSPNVRRLRAGQVEIAWNYAYRFFFEYPFAFPWRLMHFWKDVQLWPLKRVLASEGRSAFGRALGALAGEPIRW